MQCLIILGRNMSNEHLTAQGGVPYSVSSSNMAENSDVDKPQGEGTLEDNPIIKGLKEELERIEVEDEENVEKGDDEEDKQVKPAPSEEEENTEEAIDLEVSQDSREEVINIVKQASSDNPIDAVWKVGAERGEIPIKIINYFQGEDGKDYVTLEDTGQTVSLDQIELKMESQPTPSASEVHVDSETVSSLTPEAQQLTDNLREGHVPESVDDNLSRILRENGIEEEDIRTKSSKVLVKMLSDKSKGILIQTAKQIDEEQVVESTGVAVEPEATASPEPEDKNDWMDRYIDAGYEPQEAAERIERGIAPPERQAGAGDDGGNGEPPDETVTAATPEPEKDGSDEVDLFIQRKVADYQNKWPEISLYDAIKLAREDAARHFKEKEEDVKIPESMWEDTVKRRMDLTYTRPEAEEYAKREFAKLKKFNAAELLKDIVNTDMASIMKTTDKDGNPIDPNELKRRIEHFINIRLGKGGDLLNNIHAIINASLDPRKFSEGDKEIKANDFDTQVEDVIKQAGGDFSELQRLFNDKIAPSLIAMSDARAREDRGFSPYSNIVEIAQDIGIQIGGEFARGGKYDLIKIDEKGNELLHQGHFMRWLRNRMIEQHESDVDNEVDMFQRIYIIGGARTTSIQEMIFNEGMFRDGNGEILRKLKEKVYMELWLFNTSRDVDAIYRKIMGNDLKLPETLEAIYARNTFTKEGTLGTIFTAPNASANKDIDFEDDESTTENQGTGQAIRRALTTYYHAADPEMLEKIAGLDSAYFNNERFIELFVIKELAREENNIKNKYPESEWKKQRKEVKKNAESAAIKKIRKTKQFFEDTDKGEGTGKLKEGKLKDYVLEINPYNLATKDTELINEVQERMRLFIMDSSQNEGGIGLDYDEAKYAEIFAFSMTRWSGVAAKNDTGYVGFDSWTKVLELDRYRQRQAESNRAGIVGNIFTFGGLKRLGVDFFVGVKDTNGKSILEIIQGGEGLDINLQRNIDLDKQLTFGNLAMSYFGRDHVGRTFQMLQDVVENHEWGIDKIAAIDQWGRSVYDIKAKIEFQDNLLKRFRYAYSTWSGTDYSNKIRTRDKNGDWYTADVSEHLWGKQIIYDFVNGKDRDGKVRRHRVDTVEEIVEDNKVIGEKKVGKHIQSDGEVIEEQKREFWRRPMMYAIAAEIKAHREYGSGYTRYKLAQIEKIYEFLKNFSGEVEADEGDLSNTKVGKKFFSDEDINWIRIASDTTKGWLYFSEATSQGVVGFVEGIGEAAKGFFNYLFKSAP